MTKLFKTHKIAAIAIIALVSVFLSTQAFGQLSGGYTIDATKSATKTNYQNFTSAVGDMLSGTRTDGGTANGSGISGAGGSP